MKNFSLWCDFIENSFLDGEFVELLNAKKINGATSNPAIFKNAILSSPKYKTQILALKGKKAKEIYEILAILDIKKAADKLALNFSRGDDGFISFEIDPNLSFNSSLSIGEAKRLFTELGRENVMMKIPATNAGYEVMFELMKSGINVNATLIFSPEQGKKCFDALNLGLKKFRQNQPQRRVPKAVISIFVSRFDRLLNESALEKNKIGILNANLIYNEISRQNEPKIRALFASTGVKGKELAADFYIKELLLENAINTAPLEAIRAFRGGEFKQILSDDGIKAKLAKIISPSKLENAYQFLLEDGLRQFEIAFDEILKAL